MKHKLTLLLAGLLILPLSAFAGVTNDFAQLRQMIQERMASGKVTTKDGVTDNNQKSPFGFIDSFEPADDQSTGNGPNRLVIYLDSRLDNPLDMSFAEPGDGRIEDEEGRIPFHYIPTIAPYRLFAKNLFKIDEPQLGGPVGILWAGGSEDGYAGVRYLDMNLSRMYNTSSSNTKPNYVTPGYLEINAFGLNGETKVRVFTERVHNASACHLDTIVTIPAMHRDSIFNNVYVPLRPWPGVVDAVVNIVSTDPANPVIFNKISFFSMLRLPLEMKFKEGTEITSELSEDGKSFVFHIPDNCMEASYNLEENPTVLYEKLPEAPTPNRVMVQGYKATGIGPLDAQVPVYLANFDGFTEGTREDPEYVEYSNLLIPISFLSNHNIMSWNMWKAKGELGLTVDFSGLMPMLKAFMGMEMTDAEAMLMSGLHIGRFMPLDFSDSEGECTMNFDVRLPNARTGIIVAQVDRDAEQSVLEDLGDIVTLKVFASDQIDLQKVAQGLIPQRTPEMTDEEYAQLVARAQRDIEMIANNIEIFDYQQDAVDGQHHFAAHFPKYNSASGHEQCIFLMAPVAIPVEAMKSSYDPSVEQTDEERESISFGDMVIENTLPAHKIAWFDNIEIDAPRDFLSDLNFDPVPMHNFQMMQVELGGVYEVKDGKIEVPLGEYEKLVHDANNLFAFTLLPAIEDRFGRERYGAATINDLVSLNFASSGAFALDLMYQCLPYEVDNSFAYENFGVEIPDNVIFPYFPTNIVLGLPKLSVENGQLATPEAGDTPIAAPAKAADSVIKAPTLGDSDLGGGIIFGDDPTSTEVNLIAEVPANLFSQYYGDTWEVPEVYAGDWARIKAEPTVNTYIRRFYEYKPASEEPEYDVQPDVADVDYRFFVIPVDGQYEITDAGSTEVARYPMYAGRALSDCPWIAAPAETNYVLVQATSRNPLYGTSLGFTPIKVTVPNANIFRNPEFKRIEGPYNVELGEDGQLVEVADEENFISVSIEDVVEGDNNLDHGVKVNYSHQEIDGFGTQPVYTIQYDQAYAHQSMHLVVSPNDATISRPAVSNSTWIKMPDYYLTNMVAPDGDERFALENDAYADISQDVCSISSDAELAEVHLPLYSTQGIGMITAVSAPVYGTLDNPTTEAEVASANIPMFQYVNPNANVIKGVAHELDGADRDANNGAAFSVTSERPIYKHQYSHLLSEGFGAPEGAAKAPARASTEAPEPVELTIQSTVVNRDNENAAINSEQSHDSATAVHPELDNAIKFYLPVGHNTVTTSLGAEGYKPAALTTYHLVKEDGVTGVESVATDAPMFPADVYNMQGISVLRQASAEQLRSLAPGLYIVNGVKVRL